MIALPYSFGAANDAKIKQLQPLFMVDFQLFCYLCKVLLGLDVLVVQTRRTPAEQAALHAQNPLNPLLPGDHGAGRAADVNFLRGGKSVLMKASPAAAWAKVYALAEFCGIKNGSTFGAGTARAYPDNDHFYRRA